MALLLKSTEIRSKSQKNPSYKSLLHGLKFFVRDCKDFPESQNYITLLQTSADVSINFKLPLRGSYNKSLFPNSASNIEQIYSKRIN